MDKASDLRDNMPFPSTCRRGVPATFLPSTDNLAVHTLRIHSVAMSAQHEAAFRAYALNRRSALRHTAFLLCGDWHQADDLVQTTLVKLYVAWPRIKSS